MYSMAVLEEVLSLWWEGYEAYPGRDGHSTRWSGFSRCFDTLSPCRKNQVEHIMGDEIEFQCIKMDDRLVVTKGISACRLWDNFAKKLHPMENPEKNQFVSIEGRCLVEGTTFDTWFEHLWACVGKPTAKQWREFRNSSFPRFSYGWIGRFPLVKWCRTIDSKTWKTLGHFHYAVPELKQTLIWKASLGPSLALLGDWCYSWHCEKQPGIARIRIGWLQHWMKKFDLGSLAQVGGSSFLPPSQFLRSQMSKFGKRLRISSGNHGANNAMKDWVAVNDMSSSMAIYLLALLTVSNWQRSGLCMMGRLQLVDSSLHLSVLKVEMVGQSTVIDAKHLHWSGSIFGLTVLGSLSQRIDCRFAFCGLDMVEIFHFATVS